MELIKTDKDTLRLIYQAGFDHGINDSPIGIVDGFNRLLIDKSPLMDGTLYSIKDRIKPDGITWFKCEDQQPPAASGNKYGYSKQILLSNGVVFEIGNYCHGLNGADKHWHCHFLATHWAYINLPE
jgi:hypothetical protein